MIKQLLFLVYFLSYLVVAPVYSEPQTIGIDQATIEVAREMIIAISDDIYSSSKRIAELKQFSEKNILENEYGMLSITFLEVLEYDFDREPLEFAINVIPIDVANNLNENFNLLHFTFPYLGVKITAYQEGETRRRSFDLAKRIQKYGLRLLDHQQNYMPFRMSITSDRKTYKTGETIQFNVNLTNVSNVNLQVYKISKKSLYININENIWGNRKGAKKQYLNEIILRPGQSVKRSFDIGPYESPEEIEIYGVYHMAFEGVNPSAVLTLSVVD